MFLGGLCFQKWVDWIKVYKLSSTVLLFYITAGGRDLKGTKANPKVLWYYDCINTFSI